MSRTEKATFTVLVMVSDGTGNVLVQNRLDPAGPAAAFPEGMLSPGNPLRQLPSGKPGKKPVLPLKIPGCAASNSFRQRKTPAMWYSFTKQTNTMDSCSPPMKVRSSGLSAVNSTVIPLWKISQIC